MNTKKLLCTTFCFFIWSCQAEFSNIATESEEAAFFEEPQTGDAIPEQPKETIVQQDEDLLITVELEVGKSLQPIEVFIAMDTSSSMNAERRYLEQSLPKFVNDIASSNVPFKLNLLYDFNQATIDVGEAFKDNTQAFNMAIDSTNAISVLNLFFAGFQSTLKDARKDIVIVSDDDGLGTGNLADDFKLPQAGARVHVIVGQAAGTDPDNEECRIRNIGSEYMKLANKLKGAKLDLCKKNWDPLVDSIVSMIKEDPNRVLSLESLEGQIEPISIDYRDKTYLLNDENSPFKVEGKNLIIADGLEIAIADKIKFVYKMPNPQAI